MNNISNWLEQIGFAQYAEAFVQNEIGWDVLPDLTHDILKELGVQVIGHRMAILKAAKSVDTNHPGPAIDEVVDDTGNASTSS